MKTKKTLKDKKTQRILRSNWKIKHVVKEVGSGVDDTRPRLLKLLTKKIGQSF